MGQLMNDIVSTADAFTSNFRLDMILYGTLVILIVLFIPGGILSILEGRYERIVSYFKNKKKSSVAGG